MVFKSIFVFEFLLGGNSGQVQCVMAIIEEFATLRLGVRRFKSENGKIDLLVFLEIFGFFQIFFLIFNLILFNLDFFFVNLYGFFLFFFVGNNNERI